MNGGDGIGHQLQILVRPHLRDIPGNDPIVDQYFLVPQRVEGVQRVQVGRFTDLSRLIGWGVEGVLLQQEAHTILVAELGHVTAKELTTSDVLRAAGSVPYREVAHVMAAAKAAGMPRVGLVFDPMGSEEEEKSE